MWTQSWGNADHSSERKMNEFDPIQIQKKVVLPYFYNLFGDEKSHFKACFQLSV